MQIAFAKTTPRNSRASAAPFPRRNSPQPMKHVELPIAELFGIAITRGILGAGIALLFGDRLARNHRQMLGLILTAIGVLSTVPFAYDVLHRRDKSLIRNN